MKEKLKQNINLLVFCFLLLGILVVYLWKVIAIQLSNHLPIWSDEFGYYMNSYGFYLHTTTQSSLTFGGNGSILGGAYAHGFMYPLFHGSIAKLFGWSNINMIVTNYVLVGISILLVSIQKIKTVNKVFFTILLLFFAFLPLFLQTYMQEVLHLFFAVICSLFIWKIYTTETNQAKISIAFILFLIFISLFRPLWLFWTIALLPLSKNKREFALWTILFLISVLLSFIFSKLFFEFTPSFFSDFISILKQKPILTSISIFAHHGMDNIYMYFRLNGDSNYNFIKFSYIFVLLYFGIRFLLTKKRIDLACFLVIGLNIGLLICFYEASLWREIRVLSPVYYFSCLFISLKTNTFQKYLLLLFLLPSFWYASFYNPNDNLQNQHTVKEIEELKATLQDSISKLEINEKNNIILINYRPSDRPYEVLSLPLQTKEGIPIKYIIPYYDVEIGNYSFILDKTKKEKIFFREK